MAIKTDAQLTAQAEEIRDETDEDANTAVRVGQMLVDLIDSKPNVALRPLTIRGGYDVSITEAFPITGGTGTVGAIQSGNMFPVTVGGNIDLGSGPEFIPVGSILLALEDLPAQDPTKWRIL